MVLAGRYEVAEEERDGVKIRVATYAIKNPRGVKQLTDLAATVIGYYQEFLGPFPFPEYNIIEINDYGFGQAPPGILFITSEAFNPLLGDMNQLFSQGINERFAHEIAHQYWGQVVKMPSDEEQWLTEAFAEYCAAVFLKTHRDPSIYKSLEKHWKRRADFANDAGPIALANRIYDPVTEEEIRSGLLYDKGPLLLAALHKEVGDEVFFTFLKSYQKILRVEIRHHQAPRRPAPVPDEEGLHAVLREVLLGNGDASAIGVVPENSRRPRFPFRDSVTPRRTRFVWNEWR